MLPNLHLGGFALSRLLRPAVPAGPVTVLTADVDAIQRAYAGR